MSEQKKIEKKTTDRKQVEPEPVDDKYYEVLELKPDAPFIEIKSAYLHLKKLYSSESLVLVPVIDDVPEIKREKMLEEIEEAYQVLKNYFALKETTKQAVTRDRVSRKNIPEFEVYSGNALRLTREVLHVELKEIALATGIPMKHLRNIEMERYDQLPPEGYIRIYVTQYARYLSLDVRKVVGDYMRAVDNKQKK
jgi:hypothetical protein